MSTHNKLEIYRELQKELEERKKRHRLFSEEYLTVDYDSTHHWIHADWTGNLTEKTVMDGCTKMLSFLKEYACDQVLNDNSHTAWIRTHASSWVDNVWFPQMRDAGLKHFAWVYSPGRQSEGSSGSFPVSHQFEYIKSFISLDEGVHWLKEQKKQSS